MKNIIFSIAVLGSLTLMCLSYASAQTASNINAVVNADTNAGVSTSMNGNTTTSAGVPISSTAASAPTRSASGSGT
jgi:hypothetical protein